MIPIPLPGIKTVAVIIVAVALTASHWKAYHSGGKNTAAKMEVKFQTERNNWQGKVDAAEAANEKQAADNRARADRANTDHAVQLAKLNAEFKGVNREINRLTDNLSACRLSPDLSWLLNNQRASIVASERKD